MSGLVIGSTAPDTPYYLPVPVGAGPTHSGIGVVTVDVVLGLAAWVVWHGLVVRPALAAAPAGVRAASLACDPGMRRRTRVPSTGFAVA